MVLVPPGLIQNTCTFCCQSSMKAIWLSAHVAYGRPSWLAAVESDGNMSLKHAVPMHVASHLAIFIMHASKQRSFEQFLIHDCSGLLRSGPGRPSPIDISTDLLWVCCAVLPVLETISLGRSLSGLHPLGQNAVGLQPSPWPCPH